MKEIIEVLRGPYRGPMILALIAFVLSCAQVILGLTMLLRSIYINHRNARRRARAFRKITLP